MHQSKERAAGITLAEDDKGKTDDEVKSSMHESKERATGNTLAKDENGKSDDEVKLSMYELKVKAGTLVGFSVRQPSTRNEKKKVALMYNDRMLLHTPPGVNFEENPMRLTNIMEKLSKQKIIERCDLVEFTEASEKQLKYVHSAAHVRKILNISSMGEIAKASAEERDVYFSDGSTTAALLAAGAFIRACDVVASDLYTYAFAIIRPPGHHASKVKSAGFCLLNNIAVGAANLLRNHRMGKFLIIDFDIHHGDGTQSIFYDDPRVLTFSVHRYHGDFYPKSGPSSDIGRGSGKGFNINVTWDHPGIRDADYLAVWDHCLIPVIKEFRPDIILISAGFYAADNDILGECHVSPNGFAALLYKLKCFGRIVLALEGGYNLQALSDGVAGCMEVLLGDDSSVTCDYSSLLPYESTWQTIQKTRRVLSQYWDAFQNELGEEIISKSTPCPPEITSKGAQYGQAKNTIGN